MKSCTVSVPGRTEVAGNHQDHQGGCVITAAVDKRVRAHATKNNSSIISVVSENHEPFSLSLDDPNWNIPHPDELHSSKALVRGMAAMLAAEGVTVCGCDLDINSTIPDGMGFSSSAAFEVCIGSALALLSNTPLNPLAIAKHALIAERDFFGKPCGMMDQTACALGGIQSLDFSVLDNPHITTLTLPSSWNGYSYLLIDCGERHAHTTNDFARVALDMADVARFLGLDALGRITLSDYLDRFKATREALGDDVALRGLHFFHERELVQRRLHALQTNNMTAFIQATEDSGISSAEYLQNVSIAGPHQEAMVALALCRTIIDSLTSEQGANPGSARIHGGGFGGTIQAIIPVAIHEDFIERIEAVLGPGSCMEVKLGDPGILVEETK